MDNFETIIIILSLICIVIYFCFYFDIHQVILVCLGKSENFNSYLFLPQKIFRNAGKIYLLDTHRVLAINQNPLIFNSFAEYKEYILSLEKDLKEKIHLKIGKKNKKLDTVLESDIPDIDFNFKHKIEVDENNPYFKNYTCERQAAHCDLKEDISPFYHSIYDPESLKKFQEQVCQKKLLSDEQCDMIKTFQDNTRKLNQVCYSQAMLNQDFKAVFDPLCEKHKVIQNNRRLLNTTCSEESNQLSRCEMDDFFREELLSSLTPLKKNIT
jgi:hypothetical protein